MATFSKSGSNSNYYNIDKHNQYSGSKYPCGSDSVGGHSGTNSSACGNNVLPKLKNGSVGNKVNTESSRKPSSGLNNSGVRKLQIKTKQPQIGNIHEEKKEYIIPSEYKSDNEFQDEKLEYHKNFNSNSISSLSGKFRHKNHPDGNGSHIRNNDGSVLINADQIAYSENGKSPQVSRGRGISMTTFCNDLKQIPTIMTKFEDKKNNLRTQCLDALKRRNDAVKDMEGKGFFGRSIPAIEKFIAYRQACSFSKKLDKAQKDQVAYKNKIIKAYGPLLDNNISAKSAEFSAWMRNFMIAPLDNKKDAEKYINLINGTKNFLSDFSDTLDENKSKKILEFWDEQEKYARHQFPQVNSMGKSKKSAVAAKHPRKKVYKKIDHRSNVAPLQNRLDSSQSEMPVLKRLREFTRNSLKYSDAVDRYCAQSPDLQEKINDINNRIIESVKFVQVPNPTPEAFMYGYELNRNRDGLVKNMNLLIKDMNDSLDFISNKYDDMMSRGSVNDDDFKRFLDGYKYSGSANFADQLNYLKEINNVKVVLEKANHWPKDKSEYFRNFLDRQGNELKKKMKNLDQTTYRADN